MLIDHQCAASRPLNASGVVTIGRRKSAALLLCIAGLGVGVEGCAPMPAMDGSLPEDASVADRQAPSDAIGPSMDAPPEHAPAPGQLTVSSVSVATGMNMFGQLTGVASTASQRVFVGNSGSFWLNGLVLAGSTMDATPWRDAVAVPALDRPDSQWFVAIHGSGSLQRLRSFSEWINVSDQYGLLGQDLKQVVFAGGLIVAFRTASSVVLIEMSQSRVYEGAFVTIGGGEQRVAAVIDQTVRLFSMGGMQQAWAAPGAMSCTVDSNATALWTTDRELRAGQPSGASTLLFRSSAGQRVHSLVRAGSGVWMLVGTELARWDGSAVAITTGLDLPANSRLVGDPSGDAWVLTPAGPRRYSAGAVLLSPQQRWEQTVQPVYARKCINCHGPAGGQTVLDSFDDWQMYRSNICGRVLRAMPRVMPPANAPALSASERAAVDQWCMPADAGTADASVRDSGRDASTDAARDVSTDSRG
jgi:hypothetical protein